MSSDERNTPVDRVLGHAGPGTAQTFRCDQCDQYRMVLGRRFRKHKGMRQWICAGCAKGSAQ